MISEKLIIIPTYNEVDNIEPLMKSIFDMLPDTHILFVDDHSPDGTGQRIDELIKTETRLHVLHRSGKLGFASAYIEGFKWALQKGYRYIWEMDCDFSHPPTALPAMAESMKKVDYSIGSRYVSGGGTKNWGLWRRIISRFGNYYARIILLCPIKDMTGGFVCWRREVLEDFNLDAIESKGYVFQIELKYKAYRQGFTFKEVPIIFEDRRVGKSKMSKSIFFEALVRVIKIRFKSSH